MVINKESYLAACQQVYKPRASVQRILRAHAEKITEDATSLGQRPHGGGMVQDHYAGKVAEACFEYFLHRNGIQYVQQCRGLFDEENTQSDHVDYLVHFDRDFRTCDVKSGTLKPGTRFEDVPLDRVGLTVPVMQARRDATLVYSHVFLSCDLAGAVFVGWAYKWEVRSARVCKGVNGKPDFFLLPAAELHSPRELVMLSQLTTATESLERLSLARS